MAPNMVGRNVHQSTVAGSSGTRYHLAQRQYGRKWSANRAKTFLSTPPAFGRCSVTALKYRRDMAIPVHVVNSKTRICTPDLSEKESLSTLRTRSKISWCVLDLCIWFVDLYLSKIHVQRYVNHLVFVFGRSISQPPSPIQALPSCSEIIQNTRTTSTRHLASVIPLTKKKKYSIRKLD